MSVVWDTTVASKLHPGNGYEQHLMARARVDDLVAVTAPSVLEISYGLARLARFGPALSWFIWLTASNVISVLPFDAESAIVAARVRAAQPTPPTGARRDGSKAEQRVGWMLDIQIAACAWAHGYPVVTDNQRDFVAIAAIITALYPSVPPLEVLPAPQL